ncbi:encapsidation protein 22K [Human adenovirus 4]|uniref:Encapsidation protein 22K n=3 Tax=Human mastadenovirus E TaxID=130308 RepID=Q5GFA3_ADE04|nr:22K [Human mastadenovirus E]AAT97454.1 L4 22 kDa protein [Human adenovirus E4]BAU59116.1 22 kDa protein [Human adenovirus 4p]AAS66930.1 22K [Human mastadenovirus E]AAT97502.1 L4 22 kDa protein [Human adenovirus E4]ABR27511.1 22 kDa protein [Human mastadenovirus E]
MPRGSSKKLKVELPPVEDLEEDWESSQAEEEEMEDWDSTQAEDSLQDSLEDEEEAEEVEEVAAAARPSSSAEKASSTDTISAPGRGPARPHSRWDETGRFPNPTTQTGKKERQGYKSWRGHKNAIVSCLQACGGNISFTRRYLLFHRGVNFPRNILHYYRHLHSPYYFQEEAEKDKTSS